METKRFHARLGIPADVSTRFGSMVLKYSTHALIESKSDKRGAVTLPRILDTTNAQVIEVEARKRGNAWQTDKVLYQVRYDMNHSLAIALIPASRTVKTVWLNDITDNHATLDASKYDTV